MDLVPELIGEQACGHGSSSMNRKNRIVAKLPEFAKSSSVRRL